MGYPKWAERSVLWLLVVGLVLCILKLFGVITVAWWLVCLPFTPLIVMSLLVLFAYIDWLRRGGT